MDAAFARAKTRVANAILLPGPPGPMRALQVQTACREGCSSTSNAPSLHRVWSLFGCRPS